MVNTCPINTWQWWLARAHPRGWAVRTMRLTLQMRQWAEATQSILLVLTLAAEGSRRQDGRAGTGWSRAARHARAAGHTQGWGRSPPPPQHVGWKTSSGNATGIEKSSSTLAEIPLERLVFTRDARNQGLARGNQSWACSKWTRDSRHGGPLDSPLVQSSSVRGHTDLVPVKTVLSYGDAQERSSVTCIMGGMRCEKLYIRRFRLKASEDTFDAHSGPAAVGRFSRMACSGERSRCAAASGAAVRTRWRGDLGAGIGKWLPSKRGASGRGK